MTARFAVGAAVLSVLLGACGGGGGNGSGSPTWDEAVDGFAAAACEAEEACLGGDRAACEADARQDLADARAELDAAGREACVACLEAKRAELEKLLAASCDFAVVDEAAVLAVCDLDPTTDYDGDDDPANDHDEACAGYP